MLEAIVVRSVTRDDAKSVFEISNDPTVRANSISTEPITWENHLKWFDSVVDNPNVQFFIAETQSGECVGQVRFQLHEDAWIVSISLASAFRGKGLSAQILTSAMKISKISEFTAYVKTSNAASLNLFEKVGYTKIDNILIDGIDYWILKYVK